MRVLWLGVPVLLAFACGGNGGGDSNGGSGGGAGSPHGGAGSAHGGAAPSDGGTGADAGDDSAAGQGNGGNLNGGDAGSGDGGAGAESAGGNTGDAAGAAGMAPVAVIEVPPPVATITVHVSASRHLISPLIYGANLQGIACDDPTAKLGLCRLGGHPWTTYNWENNASNAGIDNCSENNAALSASAAPGAAVTTVVAKAHLVGAATLVQVPTLDYVAADEAPGTASPACSGDVRKSANYLTTRFKANHSTKGAALSSTPDTTDANVYQDEFVSFVQSQAGGAQVVLSLDNQPDTWANDHPAVHPSPATYQEVVQRNVEYATMVRSIWPSAPITGYVGYGYYGFETLQDAPDAAGKGLFIDYYLAQMKAASTTAGQRLVDYLDVHWYSEATGDGGQRVLGDGKTAGMVEARVQAPRSFWDSTYLEKSWITDETEQAIALIPWLNTHIATSYPGTKLAISEWNFGGGNDISGAIATADTLGIFGRDGVGLAAYVSTSTSDAFAYAAFSAFRNYDGAGAAFGDTSVSTTSNSEAFAPAYASVSSTDGDKVVAVVINRSNGTLPTAINVDHTTTYASAKVYQLTSASATMVAAPSVAASSPNTFNVLLPAYSITVVVPQQ
ncbi:MAG: glycoside hydrolase family 44 protein [Polyangiaceae bacterium]